MKLYAHLAALFCTTLPLALFAADEPPSSSTVNATSHTNRLAKEKSPYLLQHQHNPVNWYPWGDEAFAVAKKENKPVLLSIGYSTCHWCHVMERESFENESVAKVLNEKFIAIKLDREERPDIDHIYMSAMQALGQGGGWPLNAFITPDRKPFYGGTYFPRERFIAVLNRVDQLWKDNHDEVVTDANNLAIELAKAMNQEPAAKGTKVPADIILTTGRGFGSEFDSKWGGFGKAPKFPQPHVPGILLMAGFEAKDQSMTDMALLTCRRMAEGGIYDHLGGGFSRYAVDEKWLVPHFEKMLYDNAQLIDLFLDAGLVSGDRQYNDTVHDILRYLAKDMTHKDGGWYSAEDADSEGHEGKFYCWTKPEVMKLLGSDDGAFACEYFGITDEGNFVDHSHAEPLKGQNVLSIMHPEKKLDEAGNNRLNSIKQRLLEVRVKRIRPHLDDKILTSWNGLMLGAVARAGVILNDDAALAAARKNLEFVKDKLWDATTKTLYHRWRDGERDTAQLLNAYAYYLQGTIALYEATLDADILQFSIDLAESMITRFYDQKNGGFYTSASTTDLLFKAKDDYDGAEPAGNSVAIMALVKLAAITENKKFARTVEQSLLLFSTRLTESPQAAPLMAMAAARFMREPFRAVIAGDVTTLEGRALLRAAHSIYQPHRVILGNSGPVEEFAVTLKPQNGKPTAFVCTGRSCKLPTSDPEQVRKNLR